jgi:thiol:disulfide interchange protein
MKYPGLLAHLLIIVIASSIIGCNFETEKNNNPDYNQSVNNELHNEDLKAPLNYENVNTTGSVEEKPTENLYKYQSNLNQDYLMQQSSRMVIRTGTMSIEIEDFPQAEQKAKEITANLNGYITNSTLKVNQAGKKQGSITIRVKAENYDELLIQLSKIGKVIDQNIQGKDVTDEYIDTEARLKTQKELESRLLKLLSEKTANLTSVVEVEQKLASVRENIEKTEGKLRFLQNQTAYSTLTLNIFEPAVLNTSSGGFFYELEKGLENGLTGFTKVLSSIITIVIAGLPVFIPLFVLIFVIVKIYKRKKIVKA